VTPISNRYATTCAILLAATLGVVTLATHRTPEIDDCADPIALAEPDRFDGVDPFGPDPKMLGDVISFWSGSRIKMKHELVGPFRVAIARTHQPIRFYLQPDNISPMPFPPDKGDFEWVERDGKKLPVHILFSESRSSASYMTAFTAYTFLYHNEPVAHPLAAQLRAAIADLFGGRRPLTMLMVQGTVSRIYLAQATDFAKEWLADTAARYQEVCAE
jgi:hypothetical protein